MKMENDVSHMDAAANTTTTKLNLFITPLFAGGMAGLSVDVSLYPIDTIKTRLQSEQGFYRAGGFSGVYRGLAPVVAGSVPTAALFFISYEFIKTAMQPMVHSHYLPLVHMFAASFGEVVACLVRVPTEIAKQRRQALVSSKNRTGLQILVDAYKTEGLFRGLYRGFLPTVMRDLPFSLIQFPLWEYLKIKVADYNGGEITSIQTAMCGSVAGALAGAVTTPLDVAKTRIMLAERHAASLHHATSIHHVLRRVHRENGIRGLFAGLGPRIVAFTLGGFVFFGAYDYSKSFCRSLFDPVNNK